MATVKGSDIIKLRTKLGLNQSEFWKTLGVTQSGGSRYESGRTMPAPVQRLYWLTYIVGLLDNLPPKDRKYLAALGK